MFVNCSEKPIYAQLGFRFWDPVRNVQVTDDFEVTARTVTPSGRVFRAFRTPSGNYAFRGLPGFHDAEYPTKPTDLHAGTRVKLIIEVNDNQQNYLPVSFLFDEKLPLVPRGIYLSRIFDVVYPPQSPDTRSPLFYLYSAPTRNPVPGMAVVRCQLTDYATKKPAAHACIEVGVNGKKWFGLADRNGSAAVYFPYPTAETVVAGATSPPVSASRSLRSQKWSLSIRITYSPDSVSPPARETLPDLYTVLRQRPAHIWAHDPEETGGAAPSFTMEGELAYGHEVVLRSGTKSELYLQSVPTSP
jgi:hypothetical protein